MTLQTCPWCRPSSAPCWPAQTPPARPRGRWAHWSPRRIQPPAGPKGGTTVPPMGGGPRVGNMLGMGQTIWFIWVEFKYRCDSFGCLWKTSWDRCNCELNGSSHIWCRILFDGFSLCKSELMELGRQFSVLSCYRTSQIDITINMSLSFIVHACCIYVHYMSYIYICVCVKCAHASVYIELWYLIMCWKRAKQCQTNYQHEPTCHFSNLSVAPRWGLGGKGADSIHCFGIRGAGEGFEPKDEHGLGLAELSCWRMAINPKFKGVLNDLLVFIWV